MTISNEAVEAAARAEYEHEMSALEGTWGEASKEARALFRQSAKVALEASAGIIRAECLEQAADEIDRLDALGNIPYWDLTHEQGTEYREWACIENEQEWLRARASAERGEG